jgi:hypothetical protein
MKLSQFFTGGAIAALAAALAVTAMPAHAQDGERRGWRTAPAEDRQAARAERRAERQAERPAVQAQPAERPQVRAQRAEPRRERAEARPQRNNQSIRRQHREQPAAARGGWNTGNAPPMRPVRNPTYVDPNRNVDSRDRDDRRDGNRDWRDGRRDNDRNWRDGRRDNDRNWRDGRRDNDRDWRDGRRHNDSRWDRRWRDNSRYNWYSYRNYNRNIYRQGHYYSPYRNYNYRRLGIGVFLQSLFYSNRYWINDPWQYRLPEVYGPYRWVRYYDDALLVDVRRGEVVDVIHDFFW